MRLSRARTHEIADPESEDKHRNSRIYDAKEETIEADMAARVVVIGGSRMIPFESFAFMDIAPPEPVAAPAIEPSPTVARIDPGYQHPKAKRR